MYSVVPTTESEKNKMVKPHDAVLKTSEGCLKCKTIWTLSFVFGRNFDFNGRAVRHGAINHTANPRQTPQHIAATTT